MAELLNISNDSVYRRIRGEKPISFEEIQKLCSHYKLSLDQFLNLQSDAFTFRGQLKNKEENSFENWLQHIKQQFQLFNTFSTRHMSILMKDIPPFVHFHIPELAMFKFYFWMKSILNYPSLKGVKFNLDDTRYNNCLEQSRQIIELSLSVPTTEIWNIESVNSTIRQINFYHEAGLFPSRKTTLLMYEKLEDIINHIELQAEAGKKFGFGKSPKSGDAEYRLFVNELILGDNTYMIELNGSKMAFLNHSVIYVAATSDVQFTNSIESNFESLEKKSTMISSIGQKERSVFFNSIRKMIETRKDLV